LTREAGEQALDIGRVGRRRDGLAVLRRLAAAAHSLFLNSPSTASKPRLRKGLDQPRRVFTLITVQPIPPAQASPPGRRARISFSSPPALQTWKTRPAGVSRTCVRTQLCLPSQSWACPATSRALTCSGVAP